MEYNDSPEENPFLEDSSYIKEDNPFGKKKSPFNIISTLNFVSAGGEFYVEVVKTYDKKYTLTFKNYRTGPSCFALTETKIHAIIIMRGMKKASLLEAKNAIDFLDGPR